MVWRSFTAMRAVRCVCLSMLMSLAGAAFAGDEPPVAPSRVVHPSVEELARPELQKEEDAPESGTREAICLMIESAARANDLPLEFFARVIWQESRFQSNAVGPMTRSGQRA